MGSAHVSYPRGRQFIRMLYASGGAMTTNDYHLLSRSLSISTDATAARAVLELWGVAGHHTDAISCEHLRTQSDNSKVYEYRLRKDLHDTIRAWVQLGIVPGSEVAA